MKGIVFTELLEMVERDLGIEMADRVIVRSQTKGAYTSVGTYDHRELIQLVVALHQETGIPVATLVQSFGKYLFQRFRELYPAFFTGINSAAEFLPRIDSYVHIEVRKLYPDAELPKFTTESFDDGSFAIHYRSSRPFADLAEGLILAAIDHFGDKVELHREDWGKKDGTEARFVLQPTGAPAWTN